MPKLTALKPRIGALPPRIGYAQGDEKARDQHRAATQHWRKWYTCTEWRKLRMRVLIRDLFTCQMCKRLVADTSQLVGDHKIQHHGDRAKFFDERNVWCICKPCHDSAKQKLEKAGRFR